jgi:hypothetical protein
MAQEPDEVRDEFIEPVVAINRLAIVDPGPPYPNDLEDHEEGVQAEPAPTGQRLPAGHAQGSHAVPARSRRLARVSTSRRTPRGNVIAKYEPWQMTHMRVQRNLTDIYGTSHPEAGPAPLPPASDGRGRDGHPAPHPGPDAVRLHGRDRQDVDPGAMKEIQTLMTQSKKRRFIDTPAGSRSRTSTPRRDRPHHPLREGKGDVRSSRGTRTWDESTT